MSKILLHEHRIPSALRLRRVLHLFVQGHEAVVITPDASSLTLALAQILERATKLLHTTPALLPSSKGRCSRQGRFIEFTKGELGALIE